jgi:hypothetical protein
MVLLELVDGKKGPGDILVLVTAYNEPLSFGEWLFLGKCYLDSEAVYYPIQEGYIGKAMLMNAINEISQGVPFEKVLERYKLKRKGKGLNVVDKRKRANVNFDVNRGVEVKISSLNAANPKMNLKRG